MNDTPPTPSLGEMLEELIDLCTGFGVALLPALLLAVPGIILFVVLPAILLLPLALPLVVIAAPPYLLARWLRRRRDATPTQNEPRAFSRGPARAVAP